MKRHLKTKSICFARVSLIVRSGRIWVFRSAAHHVPNRLLWSCCRVSYMYLPTYFVGKGWRSSVTVYNSEGCVSRRSFSNRIKQRKNIWLLCSVVCSHENRTYWNWKMLSCNKCFVTGPFLCLESRGPSWACGVYWCFSLRWTTFWSHKKIPSCFNAEDKYWTLGSFVSIAN